MKLERRAQVVGRCEGCGDLAGLSRGPSQDPRRLCACCQAAYFRAAVQDSRGQLGRLPGWTWPALATAAVLLADGLAILLRWLL